MEKAINALALFLFDKNIVESVFLFPALGYFFPFIGILEFWKNDVHSGVIII